MREFYIKDKKTNVVFRGFIPTTDIDCLPFDYFRLEHACLFAKLFQDVLKNKCPVSIPDKVVRQFTLQKMDEKIRQIISKGKPHPVIHQLLTDDTLSYKEQKRLLKDVTLTLTDLLWWNKEAQDMGYLMNIYYEEKYPKKFNEKMPPWLFYQNKDGIIKIIGATDMTEGEMCAMLEQRKVIQARIYHKKSIWHCLYFTFKGLAGEEHGRMGSMSHYHYLSNKSGLAWDDLQKRIKDCDMPSSEVHIVINRNVVDYMQV